MINVLISKLEHFELEKYSNSELFISLFKNNSLYNSF